MLFERWTGARVFRRWMPKPLFYKNVILIVTEGSIKRRLVKKVWIFLGLSVRENPDKTRLTFSSFSDPLWFASLYWWPLFSLFSGESLYVLLALLFARYSPFYLCLFLFSFFLLSRSAYFGVLSNFLARFSRLTLRLLPLVFFVCVCVFFITLSLSTQPIFTQNPLSTNLNYDNFLPLTSARKLSGCFLSL